jgi:hypothetical protein
VEASVSIILPHGFSVNGELRRELGVRPVGAEDDAFLVESSGTLPAHRVNALLSRCIRPTDAWPFDPGTIVRSLVAGDREALLLHLRRVTLGDDFVGLFRCAAPACAEPLELALRASDLLLPPYPETAERYARTVEHDGVSYDVSFRLPTAGDLEDVVDVAGTDTDVATRGMLRRCLERVAYAGRMLDVTALPQPAGDRIAAAMAALDPQAIIEFDLTCPACGTSCSTQFDPGDFLLRELDQRVDRTLHEVHTLALCYHWSEAAILAMPQARRERYLDLIGSGAGAALP